MLTDKQILGPGVTDVTLLLDILPAGEAKSNISPAMARILSYYYVPGLHLVRTPRCIGFNMPPYHVIVSQGLESTSTTVVGCCAPKIRPEYDNSHNLISVGFKRPDLGTSRFHTTAGLWGPRTSIMESARDLFGDTKSVKLLWPRVLAVISASLMDKRAEKPCLLVTNDQQLLTHQAHIQKMFLGHPVHIVAEAEALRILDLYQKQIHRYWPRPYHEAVHSRYGWYWSAAQADLPNVPEQSILIRAMHVRYAIDSLGTAYYGSVYSSDTEESTYHFNYLLLLLAAALDETALQVATHYGFGGNFASMRPPENEQSKGKRVTFYNKMRAANSELEDMWRESAAFLRLLYSLRDASAHIEVLAQLVIERLPKYSGQRIIVLNLSKWTPGNGETPESMFEAVSDPLVPFEPCSSLGVVPMGPVQQQLKCTLLVEPYHFGVTAWARVRYLLNESARMIGHPVQISDMIDDPKNWSRNWARTFKDQALDGLELNMPHH